jgi:alginate O-acetyltransferase complex protein AlgI
VLLFFKYRFVQQIFIPRGDQAAVRGADFIFLIGISYSSFKAIHFITDSYKRTIKSAGILEFLNFMFFFPSFISGPINRFNHFVENAALKKKMTGRRDIGPGAERIVHGLFKKVALATLVFPYALTNVSTPLQQMQPWTIVLGLYAYALYFYFDFSGYTDLAIGSARLMGFVLPENFDLPFLKRNIQQLWMHWHMSLTGWLTEYIYWPIVRRLRQGDALRAHPVLISNIAIVITFLVCGLWHGEGANFVLWGLFHGVGIATVNVYQSWKRKIRHERALRYFRSPVSYCVGVAATFSFFAVGLTMFVLDMQQIGVLARRLLTVL